MAEKTIKGLAERILKNDSSTREDLRKILEGHHVNVLRLTHDQLDLLEKAVRTELAATTSPARERTLTTILSEIVLAEEKDLYYELSPQTWGPLEQIRDIMKKQTGVEYELGHSETSVLALNISLIIETLSSKQKVTAEDKKKIQYLEKLLGVATVIDNAEDHFITTMSQQITSKGFTDKDLITLIDSINAGAVIDVSASTNFISSINTEDWGTISIILEPSSVNRDKGDLSRLLGNKVAASFRNIFSATKTPFAKKVAEKVFTNVDAAKIKSSPSVIDNIDKFLASEWTDGKIKKPKRKQGSKVRLSRKETPINSRAKALRKKIDKKIKTLKTYEAAMRQKKKFLLPTVTLKAIINESLAQFIRDRMGKPSDPPVNLRNQTGRFSESAILLTLNRQETGVYVGTYDFMQNPYGVFLPGGRLHTQQRDPRLYIEGAIREIAHIVLKNQYKGMALEHK